MNQEDKDILLRLLQQHKELGISGQIDYQKFYLDSVISGSVALSDLRITGRFFDSLKMAESITDSRIYGFTEIKTE